MLPLVPRGRRGRRGQLKQVLLGMASEVLPFPEVAIGAVASRFDEQGKIQNDKTRDILQKLVAALAERARIRA